MEDITCEVCFSQFDEKFHVPKFLTCGHTFCHVCISSFHNQGKCPKCKRQFEILLQNDCYPTNYSLLGTIEAYKGFAASPWNIKSRIEKLKVSMQPVYDYLRDYAQVFNDMSQEIGKLGTLFNKSYNELEIIETHQVVSNCEAILQSSVNFLDFGRKDINLFMKLESFDSEEKFMIALLDEIRTEESNIYAFHKVGQKVKFGKISRGQSDMLYICSLIATMPAPDSKFILFSDIKQCYIKKGVYLTFIDIPTGYEQHVRMMIEVNNFSLSTQFIRICSGETGVLFKGSKINVGPRRLKSSMPMTVIPNITGSSNTHNADYVSEISNSSNFIKGSVLVESNIKGKISIFRVQMDSSFQNIIGKVLNFGDIKIIPETKVVESGIAFSVRNWR